MIARRMNQILFSAAFVVIASVVPGNAAEDGGFRQALPGYVYSFPRDHGSHPEFKTEWWYFTGNLEAEDGRAFGYELTIFRYATLAPAERVGEDPARSPLTADQIYIGHFAISDIARERHQSWERIGRRGLGQAGASTETLNVFVGDWRIVQTADGAIELETVAEAAGLDLRLTPRKPPVIHGTGGAHQKTAAAGHASHYISFTRLATEGELRWRGETYRVAGSSWMDHEFFSGMLGEAVGWNWFALQLDNGLDLMIYQIRNADGSYSPAATGTLVTAAGETVVLEPAAYSLEATGEWTSPASGATYPMGWRIGLPGYGARLTVEPAFEAQEMQTTRVTGTVYWEGAVRIEGAWSGEAVTGKGYVELVGYAGGLRGL